MPTGPRNTSNGRKPRWGFAQDPTRESYPIEAWSELVRTQVQAIEERGGLATVLMHPLCMFIADRFPDGAPAAGVLRRPPLRVGQ